MGDCLLTTIIARQIKEVDFPGCHLTWVIGDRFREVLNNNPHVDEVVTVSAGKERSSFMSARYGVRAFVAAMAESGKRFDKVFVLDLDEKNMAFLWGTCRSIYMRMYHELYGHRVTVSPEPVVVLADSEVEKVHAFCHKNKLDEPGAFPILIEYSPNSGQSIMNKERALSLAEGLVAKFPHVLCVLSSKEPVCAKSSRIIDGSELSYRENAELINHCRLLVGANSGITWLNASTWSKKIPMVQDVVMDFTDNLTGLSFSVEMDYKNVGASTENLIELRSVDFDALFECVCDVVGSSFAEAKAKHAEIQVPVSEYMYQCYATKHKTDGSVGGVSFGGLPNARTCNNLTVRLFDFLPFLSIKRKKNQVRVRLFGIPLLKIKERSLR